MALVGAAAMVTAAAFAPVVAADEPRVVYTLLGRGFAAVVAYPVDEVPPTGEDEPADPPPDQTCPEDGRGVDESTAARLAALSDPGDRPPTEPTVTSTTPTPRGQPIRFIFGLADGSLRSDPGVHGIAAGFYVDLGGAQDPWTSAEADGFVSGHARRQERCGNLYAGEAGSAEDVHVLAEAVPGPRTDDYTHLRRTLLPGLGSFESSVTRVQMDGTSTPATARLISTVEGIELLGTLRIDQVTSVVDYRTDGTTEGTVVTAWSVAEGVSVDGQPVTVAEGAPPVAEEGFVLGLAAPQVRQLDDHAIEVDGGGLYVGTQVPNPLGLQAKQSVSFGGVQLSASAFQARSPAPPATEGGAPGETGGPSPTTAPTTAPSTFPGPATPSRAFAAAPPAPAPVAQPDVAGPEPATVPVMAVRRLGVFVTPPQVAGAVGVTAGTALAMAAIMAVWLRHRSWRFRVLLGAPGLRRLDRAYRAFLRG